MVSELLVMDTMENGMVREEEEQEGREVDVVTPRHGTLRCDLFGSGFET